MLFYSKITESEEIDTERDVVWTNMESSKQCDSVTSAFSKTETLTIMFAMNVMISKLQ